MALCLLLGIDLGIGAGIFAGATTTTPALAFAHGMCGSEAPSVAYASVYPLTMVLRIAAAQLLVLFFAI